MMITRSYQPGSLIPYGRVVRHDGAINHGWIDLRGHPELVASIPEAQRSEGLSNLLRVIAAPGSPLMSGACECAVFDRPELDPAQRWQAGGFVTVVFQDAEKTSTCGRCWNWAPTFSGALCLWRSTR